MWAALDRYTLDADSMDVFDQLVQYGWETGAGHAKWGESGLVFTEENGKPLHPASITTTSDLYMNVLPSWPGPRPRRRPG